MKKLFSIVLLMLCCCLLAGQAYHIGDLYTAPDGSQGIVYYVHPDGSGGWVVALKDASAGCAWGDATSDVVGLENQSFSYQPNLMKDTAGYTHTMAIRAHQNGNVSYACGCVDFDHGWYLPAPAQLRALFANWPLISSAVMAAGGRGLAESTYWCSAEISAANALMYDFGTRSPLAGGVTSVSKTTLNHVRAVRSFSYQSASGTDYLWNTGDTTRSVTVTPAQTTTYSVTVSSPTGCDGVAQHTIVVNMPDTVEMEHTVCEHYDWNGTTYTESGDYTQTFTNQFGCDSIVTLHLTVYYGTHNVTDTTVCESFTWTGGSGETYSVSGTYLHDYTNSDGCPSADTLHLTVYYGTHNVTDTTVCESFTWTGGTGETYTVSGTYIYDYTNRDGCPSADTLHLTVNYGTHNVTDTTVCESYTWAGGSGETYTVSGTYIYDYTNRDGCPSADTLHLTVNYGTHNVTDTTVCESYTWTDGSGETYTVSGTYTYDYTNRDGCPSADTLHLTVNYGTHNVTDTTVCESYTWAGGTGETYTVSGTYIYDYTNSDGCPSADTLHLTVHHGMHQSETVVGYDSYDWNGHTYTQSGDYTYIHTDENGCEQVDTLHLTLFSSSEEEFSAVACESYIWNDSVYTASGDYVQAFLDIHSADSVVTLHLTVNYGTHNVTDTTVCESFTWAGGSGETYTVSGTYTYDYTNSDGCPSADTLHLTVNYGTHNVTDTAVCESYTWTGGTGDTYTESGTYTFSYTNADGCPSADTLHLTVNHPQHQSETVIGYDSVVWNGTMYIESGDYTYSYTDENGCDAMDTLHLTLYHSTSGEITVIACDSFIWNDSVYTVSGDYVQILSDIHGTDSTMTLHLTVNHSVYELVEATACDSYEWNGQVYTESGDYPQTFDNQDGCDSIVTLHLTVNHGTHNVTDTAVCESYTWTGGTGDTYTESGTYTFSYTNAAGCASTDTLHLAVHHAVYELVETTACESYEWNGQFYTESGDYTQTFVNQYGCDSVVTLHLTVNRGTHHVTDTAVCGSYTWTAGTGDTYTESGTYTFRYTNADGCPSADTLHLSMMDLIAVTVAATTDTVCPGDSVTLYADAIAPSMVDSHVPPVAVGDILCTDNSIVKPSEWPVPGKTAMGIVCYVDNSDEHGWAIHLHDYGTRVAWSTTSTDISGLANFATGVTAITDLDGYTNTQRIRSAGNASTYPAAYAVDFAQGWYLPASAQMRCVYSKIPILNASLQMVGGTPFSMTAIWGYWSSTEADSSRAWHLDENGQITSYYKTTNYLVRSARNF